MKRTDLNRFEPSFVPTKNHKSLHSIPTLFITFNSFLSKKSSSSSISFIRLYQRCMAVLLCAYFQIVHIEVNTLTTYKGSFYFSLYSKNYTRSCNLDASFTTRRSKKKILAWFLYVLEKCFFFSFILFTSVQTGFPLHMVICYNLVLISCCSFILKSKILLILLCILPMRVHTLQKPYSYTGIGRPKNINFVNALQTNKLIGFRFSNSFFFFMRIIRTGKYFFFYLNSFMNFSVITKKKNSMNRIEKKKPK